MNGLIIQWGTESISGNPKSYNLQKKMPISFTNVNTYTLTVSPLTWTNYSTYRIGDSGSSKKDGQNISISFYGRNSEDTLVGLSWIAIGY